MKNLWLLSLKDLKAYYFKPATVSWGILFPLVFILIFMMKGQADISQLFGGLISMSIFFGATSMTATSIMMERKINIFNIYYTLPISYSSIALGKITSGLLFGLFTSTVMFLITLFLAPVKVYSVIWLLLWFISSSFAFSAFGVFLSLIVKEAYDAMTYMNLIRLPLIFVSGIFIPISRLSHNIRIISYFSPLSYSAELSNYVFFKKSFFNPVLSLTVLLVFGFILFLLSASRINKLRG